MGHPEPSSWSEEEAGIVSKDFLSTVSALCICFGSVSRLGFKSYPHHSLLGKPLTHSFISLFLLVISGYIHQAIGLIRVVSREDQLSRGLPLSLLLLGLLSPSTPRNPYSSICLPCGNSTSPSAYFPFSPDYIEDSQSWPNLCFLHTPPFCNEILRTPQYNQHCIGEDLRGGSL